MAHTPHKQDSDQHGLDGLSGKQLQFRLGAVDVDLDLLEVLYFVRRHVADPLGQLLNRVVLSGASKVVLYQVGVLLMLPLQCALLETGVNGHVVAEEHPGFSAHVWNI